MKIPIRSSTSFCIYCKKRLNNLDTKYHRDCFQNMDQFEKSREGLFLPLMFDITDFPFSFTAKIKDREYRILVERIRPDYTLDYAIEYSMDEFYQFHGFPTINKDDKLMNYDNYDHFLRESSQDDDEFVGYGTNIDWSKITLDNVTGINLRKGFVKQIPEDIGRLDKLTHLSIVAPELKNIWADLENPNSEIHNLFERLIYKIPNLKRFETHWISNFSHSNTWVGLEFPKSLKKLTNLQRLDIDICGLKEFPEVLLQLPKLEEVHFYYFGADIGWYMLNNPKRLENFENKEFFESIPKIFFRKIKDSYEIN